MTQPIDGLTRAADSMIRRLMRHRERYVRAWCAATGLHPTECELVEEQLPFGDDMIMRTRVYIRRRSKGER